MTMDKYLEAMRIAMALADIEHESSADPYEGGFYPGLDDLIDAANKLKADVSFPICEPCSEHAPLGSAACYACRWTSEARQA